MMNSMFANTAANAQGFCAASACSEMNGMILIMDASLLLASIIILLVVRNHPTHRNMTSPFPCLPSQV